MGIVSVWLSKMTWANCCDFVSAESFSVEHVELKARDLVLDTALVRLSKMTWANCRQFGLA